MRRPHQPRSPQLPRPCSMRSSPTPTPARCAGDDDDRLLPIDHRPAHAEIAGCRRPPAIPSQVQNDAARARQICVVSATSIWACGGLVNGPPGTSGGRSLGSKQPRISRCRCSAPRHQGRHRPGRLGCSGHGDRGAERSPWSPARTRRERLITRQGRQALTDAGLVRRRTGTRNPGIQSESRQERH